MPVRSENLSVYKITGSFLGPFTAVTKSVLQGRALNAEMPEGKVEHGLYYTAFVLDCLLWMSLIGIHLIGSALFITYVIEGMF